MEDLSVNRSENKYLINEVTSMQIEKKLSTIIEKDEHSNDGGYIVRSLYFDSINNIDFMTKLAGTEVRKKIRIRSYSTEDKFVKLEAKLKNGDLQNKVSVSISREDAKELINCNYSVLLKYFEKSEASKLIYRIMALGCYRPVAMIEYDRMAFTYPYFNTRLTLDKHIRSSETNYNIFDKDIVFTPIFNEMALLEIKYDEHLMKFISKTLQQFNLNKTSFSKYCVGRPNFYNFLS